MQVFTTRQVFYSNLDDAGKAAAVTAGVGAAATLGAALAQRQKRPLSEVEQKCGKKPLFGKKKKQAWQDCVNKTNEAVKAPASAINPPPPSAGNKNKTLIIASISVVVLAVVGVVIYKMRKTK